MSMSEIDLDSLTDNYLVEHMRNERMPEFVSLFILSDCQLGENNVIVLRLIISWLI